MTSKPSIRPSIPIDRPAGAEYRNVLRLLGMVHELHKQGWQRLRIHSGLSPSGGYWRCALFPLGLTHEEQDLYYDQQGPNILVARYTTGDERQYFGWNDCAKDDSRHLAQKFIERFPTISEMSRGRDWVYAGWFTELLGHGEHGRFPVSYWDAMTDECVAKMNRAVWLEPGDELAFPLPPPQGVEADFQQELSKSGRPRKRRPNAD